MLSRCIQEKYELHSKKILSVNIEFFLKIQATAAPLMEETGTKYLFIFRLTNVLINYTLKNKIRVSMLFSVIWTSL